MSEPEDPLDGASIGETKTVTETVDLYGINMAPDVFYGSDRFGDADIVDVEIVETGDENYNNIKVRWEGDITKRLPRRWDYHREPVTEREKKTAARKKWLSRGIQAASLVIPFGLATVIATHIMGELNGAMTVNGETVTMPTLVELAPALLAIFLITGLVMWGMKGGLPGKVRAER